MNTKKIPTPISIIYSKIGIKPLKILFDGCRPKFDSVQTKLYLKPSSVGNTFICSFIIEDDCGQKVIEIEFDRVFAFSESNINIDLDFNVLTYRVNHLIILNDIISQDAEVTVACGANHKISIFMESKLITERVMIAIFPETEFYKFFEEHE